MAYQYPDTLLNQDQLDPPFGGVPANRWGKPARMFIDAVLQFLGKAHLDYHRQPYKVLTAKISTGGVLGDGVCFDTGVSAANGGYTVRQIKSGGLTDDVTYPVGILIEPCAAGALARIAFAGVVPQLLTGLVPGQATGPLTYDVTTGKLRAAVLSSGELTYAYGDLQGNALILPAARVA